jgi:hypothetical protein
LEIAFDRRRLKICQPSRGPDRLVHYGQLERTMMTGRQRLKHELKSFAEFFCLWRRPKRLQRFFFAAISNSTGVEKIEKTTHRPARHNHCPSGYPIGLE